MSWFVSSNIPVFLSNISFLFLLFHSFIRQLSFVQRSSILWHHCLNMYWPFSKHKIISFLIWRSNYKFTNTTKLINWYDVSSSSFPLFKLKVIIYRQIVSYQIKEEINEIIRSLIKPYSKFDWIAHFLIWLISSI